MKIAIIGGGWVGCNLAYKLKKEHKITLFDKNDTLFSETSYKNQNRLHYGFHYPRNSKTRNLCKNTFYKFHNEYPFLLEKVDRNIYCVPKIGSKIDFETFTKIFEGFESTSHNINLQNVEGCVNTKEMYINFKRAKKFFNKELSGVFIQKKITKKLVEKLCKEYDLVINVTNNQLKNEEINESFFELTLTLIYKKIKSVDFDGLTLVDGNFFSIYPYSKNYYTLTDVEYTPLLKFKKNKNIEELYNKKYEIQKIKKKIEKKVKNYFPNFDEHFKYKKYFLSVKSKIPSTSDDRYPIITEKDNLIHCFTGKIQGIYIIEDYVNNLIKKNENISR